MLITIYYVIDEYYSSQILITVSLIPYIIYAVTKCMQFCVLCTVYSVHCTLYTVYCTLYNVQCTVYNVQCTVYIRHCTYVIAIYRFLVRKEYIFTNIYDKYILDIRKYVVIIY